MGQLLKTPYKINFTVKFVTYIALFICIYLIVNVYLYNVNLNSLIEPKNSNNGLNLQSTTKNILVWNKYYLIFKTTKNVFSNLQCKVDNCIFTDNKNFLGGDYTQFDAIIFDDGDLVKNENRPLYRALSQIYVFTTIESAYNKPACEIYNDDFFNWTFTYRLDSNVVWNYFVVRNVTGHAVAPSKDVVWQISNSPINPKVKSILNGKTKAAAWLVSHCRADSLRDEYLTRLQEHLFHFSLQIDVYGSCSSKKCTDDDCEEMLSQKYYFYMAFENSFSEDYVTEKVLHGYDNYVVPIVYGGANYTRFLPSNSYINARGLHPYNLAYLIHRAVTDPKVYESYFRWTNSYTIDAYAPGHHPLCAFCKTLHQTKIAPVYKQFRRWWNGRNKMKWCLPEEYWNEASLTNLDATNIFTLY